MPIDLTSKQRAFLRARAHALQAHLQLGKQGATDAFRRELDGALGRDELVKIRVGKLVEVDLDALASDLGAALVQRVGHNAVFYRPATDPVLVLPGPG